MKKLKTNYAKYVTIVLFALEALFAFNVCGKNIIAANVEASILFLIGFAVIASSLFAVARFLENRAVETDVEKLNPKDAGRVYRSSLILTIILVLFVQAAFTVGYMTMTLLLVFSFLIMGGIAYVLIALERI